LRAALIFLRANEKRPGANRPGPLVLSAATLEANQLQAAERHAVKAQAPTTGKHPANIRRWKKDTSSQRRRSME